MDLSIIQSIFKEETHTFGNAKVTIYINNNTEEEIPQYICVIDVVFKI